MDPTSKIPKIIFMCYKDLQPLQYSAQLWKRLNPDYEIQLYDNSMCETFLEKEYSSLHRELFKLIPDGPIKADFWRVCILYKYGGLYVDADIEPLMPLLDYIEKDVDFVTCLSANHYDYNPHFIMACSGDAYLKTCIDLYVQYCTTNLRPYSYHNWGIPNMFSNVIGFGFNKFMEGTYDHNGKKYQFLKEMRENIGGETIQYCIWNAQRVLNNCHSQYKNHSFICDNSV